MFDTGKFFEKLDMFGIRLGLAATEELMQRAGNPEKKLRFIHIAGTNGKGSVGAMLERALREAGLRTGFYTSPHLIDIRERFRINGKAVSVEKFNRLGEWLNERSSGGKYSYFEFATVLAMVIFADAQTDVVIWETGMGGRLDATNAVMPQCSVITNIALDHQGHLGNTIADIAAEKAGIIKPGIPVFYGNLPDDAKQVICQRAEELSSPVIAPRGDVPAADGFSGISQRFTYDGRQIVLSLPGKMQRENFRIVYEILSFFAPLWNFDLNTALSALDKVQWHARFQHIGNVIVDGGHNPDGVRALTEAVQERYRREKFVIVYAAFGDKHAPECLKYLEKIAERFIFTVPGAGGRAAFEPEELLQISRVPGIAENDPVQAVKLALAQRGSRVIISGSLYLAGIALGEMLPANSVLDI